MSGLSAEDKAALDDSWDFGPFGGLEHQYAAVELIVARHTAAAVAAFKAEAVAAIEAELASEEQRLAGMGGYSVGMLANWLGGIKVGARIVRNLSTEVA